MFIGQADEPNSCSFPKSCQRISPALFWTDSSLRNIHYDLDKRLTICTYLLIIPSKYCKYSPEILHNCSTVRLKTLLTFCSLFTSLVALLLKHTVHIFPFLCIGPWTISQVTVCTTYSSCRWHNCYSSVLAIDFSFI